MILDNWVSIYIIYILTNYFFDTWVYTIYEFTAVTTNRFKGVSGVRVIVIRTGTSWIIHMG